MLLLTPQLTLSLKFVGVDADGKIVDADRVMHVPTDFDSSFRCTCAGSVRTIDYHGRFSHVSFSQIAANLFIHEYDDASVPSWAQTCSVRCL